MGHIPVSLASTFWVTSFSARLVSLSCAEQVYLLASFPDPTAVNSRSNLWQSQNSGLRQDYGRIGPHAFLNRASFCAAEEKRDSQNPHGTCSVSFCCSQEQKFKRRIEECTEEVKAGPAVRKAVTPWNLVAIGVGGVKTLHHFPNIPQKALM